MLINKLVVINLFELNVDQHANAHFTTNLFVSSMELGPSNKEMRLSPPATQCPSIALKVIFKRVAIASFVLHVHQHANARIKNHLIFSKMELGPYLWPCFSSSGLSSTPRDWEVVPAGDRFLRNKRTHFQKR
jgi:hypothetical protein